MSVTNNAAKSRYELAVGKAVAFADYQISGEELLIKHVETPKELRGQGVAAKLMDGIVADAHQKGLAIIPLCSYAAAYMERHKE